MPISISKAQKEAIDSGFLDLSPSDNDVANVRLGITEKVLAQYGAEFQLKLAEYANKRGVTASGDLESNITFRIINGNTLQLIVADYFDFPNEGVRGVKSSKNAPNSPYKFKSYGMNQQGRQSIKKYIESGRAKIANVKRDKAFGIGSERKGKSLIDTQIDTMIYLIKKYGIKATNYFNDAIKDTFSDFELVMSEAIGRDIVFTLEKLNRK